MGLTLQSVYAPLRDYFLQQFTAKPASPVFFRFSKYGSALGDQDFKDENHPELGYLPALATEKFSELVNHIPLDAGDGVNIVLSDSAIDDTYNFRLLTPAQPWIPDGTDDIAKQALLESFASLKAAARRIFDNLRLESSSGLMMSFKPSNATPEGWYDATKNDAWTTHSVTVSDTTTVTTPGGTTSGGTTSGGTTAGGSTAPGQMPLWKLRASQAQFQEWSEQPPAPQPLKYIMATPNSRAAMVNMVVTSPGISPATSTGPTIAMRRVDTTGLGAEASRIPRPPAPIAPRPPAAAWMATPASNFQMDYSRQYHAMPVKDRLQLDRYVGQNQPTQSVTTTTITISFDYCLVNIGRPWYVAAFMDSPSWCLPGVQKGALSAAGPIGNFPMIPVGFVAVRNLSIEANWAAQDITAAANATNFGPFKIKGEVINNKLTNPGVQIIGWLLENTPPLPPNDPQ